MEQWTNVVLIINRNLIAGSLLSLK